MGKFCPTCNAKYDDSVNFCMKCGSALKKDTYKDADLEKYNHKQINKKALSWSALALTIIGLCVCYFCYVTTWYPNSQYKDALVLIEQKQYEKAYQILEQLGDFRDAKEQICNAKYNQAKDCVENCEYEKALSILNQIDDQDRAIRLRTEIFETLCDKRVVSTSGYHIVAVQADGTVVAIGKNEYGRCDVEEWEDIISVYAGFSCTIGLKSDGTVVTTEKRDNMNTHKDWTNIIAIEHGAMGVFGLRIDGTVVTDSLINRGVTHWNNIIAISASNFDCFGLKSDGTVISTSDVGMEAVKDWRNVVAIAAGDDHIVGLKSDGTVVAAVIGDSSYEWKQAPCDVEGWNNIIAIATESYRTLGLKADGTVVATLDIFGFDQKGIKKWKDIKEIVSGGLLSVGVKEDGMVVCTKKVIELSDGAIELNVDELKNIRCYD